jgi:3-phosphoshikimate 1-carboxyvinyltransferase
MSAGAGPPIVARPCGALRGNLRPIGDKSLTHRSLILAALASGRSVIKGANPGEDCAATAGALARLGAGVRGARDEWEIEGVRALRDADDVIDCGNAGTGIRLLTGLVAGQSVYAVLTGDSSLRGRPMKRIAEPLRAMGAEIWLREDAFPPIAVRGAPPKPIRYTMPVASAQVKGSILLAGLGLREGEIAIDEPGPSRDHTERLLAWLGYPIRTAGACVTLTGSTKGHDPFSWTVPADISAAAFYLVAGSITPRADLLLEGVLLNPTRTGVIDVLRSMGAAIDVEPADDAGPEPTGSLRVRASALHGVTVAGSLTVRALDEVPILAVAAVAAEGETVIRDARELRVKESDRIESTAALARALGASVETGPDWIAIRGCGGIRGGSVETCGDHRIAMSALVAGCASREGVVIDCGDSIATSDPSFLEGLARLGAEFS